MWWAAAQLMFLVSCSNAYYEDSKYVTSLDAKDLYNLKNEQSDNLWLVEFYNGSAKSMEYQAKAYETAARSMEGYVKVGALDVQIAPLVQVRLQLTKLPSYAFYSYYKYRPNVVRSIQTVNYLYHLAAEQITSFFEKRSTPRFVADRFSYELGKADVEKRLNTSLDAWVVVYYDVNSEGCRGLVEDWSLLVATFKYKIQFGAVNDPIHKALGDGVEYPTVKYYPRGKNKDAQSETYAGKMDYQSLYTFLDGKIEAPVPEQVTSIGRVVPCLRMDYCVFTFIPSLEVCDWRCRVENLQSLTAAGEEYKLQSIMWLWNEYDEQPFIEDVFGLEKSAHLVMVFYNMQTGKYGKINSDAIKLDVIREIFENRLNEQTLPYSTPNIQPPIIRNVEPSIYPNSTKDEL